MKRLAAVAALAASLVLLFFEVEFEPRFRLPGTEDRVDAEQEARYEACVEEFDRQIHGEVFERVDNPDVQRELLYRRMQSAKAECREKFPERRVTVELPLEFNLVDLAWRY